MEVPECRALGVLVDLRLPPQGGGPAEILRAVDERNGAADPVGHRLGRAAGAGQLVPAASQLVDGLEDPLHRSREEPDGLEHHQRRDGHRPEGGPGLGDVGRDRNHGHVPFAGQAHQLAASGDHHERRTGLVGGGGRLEGLLGVAREGDGEDQRPGADVVGGLVPLDDRDRHRHEGGRRGDQDVAGDATAAHAEDHHVFDLVAERADRRRSRAALTASATCSGRADGGAPHVEGVHAEGCGTLDAGSLLLRSRWSGAAGRSLGHQPLVLSLVDGGRLVDEHHRDAVAHRVARPQARVVEAGPRRRSRAAGPCPRGRRAPRSAAGRASSGVPLSVVRFSGVGSGAWGCSHGGCGTAVRPRARRRSRPGPRRRAGGTRGLVGCLHVEAQQGLGVRRTEVVPPVTTVHREPVQAVGRAQRAPGALHLGGQQLDGAGRVVDLGVDLA